MDSGLQRMANMLIRADFKNAIVIETGWEVIANAVKQSEQLLNDTIQGKADAVAAAIDVIHADKHRFVKNAMQVY